MDGQENIRRGLSPELRRYMSPEAQREREEDDRERMEALIRAEMHLERLGEMIEEMKR
jgi:Na+/phosphate symporter